MEQDLPEKHQSAKHEYRKFELDLSPPGPFRWMARLALRWPGRGDRDVSTADATSFFSTLPEDSKTYREFQEVDRILRDREGPPVRRAAPSRKERREAVEEARKRLEGKGYTEGQKRMILDYAAQGDDMFAVRIDSSETPRTL